VLVALSQAGSGADPDTKTHLAVRQTRFTVNGEPRFLIGCSYYGALGASDTTWAIDLNAMQKAGISWIRVWATWAANGNDVSAVDGVTGEPRDVWMKRLQTLVSECDRRGMIVDVTLSRGNGATGPARLQTDESHRNAVESVVAALKPWRNWYLDLANERSVRDKRHVSFEELKRLRDRVRQRDPDRLVTASHGSDISDDELQKYVLDVQVDFITPHRPRVEGSPAQTEKVCRHHLESMKKLGRVIPVHFQEPLRRGYGTGFQPKAADFETDLRGAIQGGAAGWCFHNGQSFDLRTEALFNRLDNVELEVVKHLKNFLPAPDGAKQ
jgi:hypothetical protein